LRFFSFLFKTAETDGRTAVLCHLLCGCSYVYTLTAVHKTHHDTIGI